MEFSATIEDPVSLKQWVKSLQHLSRLGQDDVGFVINRNEVRDVHFYYFVLFILTTLALSSW